MNRKNIVILSSLVILGMCCLALSGVLIYSAATSPIITKGLESFGNQMRNLGELQKKLIQEYPEALIETTLTNGHELVITLSNPDPQAMPMEEWGSISKEVAIFVKKNYKSIDTIDIITINFEQQVKVGITASSSQSFVYRVEDLK